MLGGKALSEYAFQAGCILCSVGRLVYCTEPYKSQFCVPNLTGAAYCWAVF